MGEPISAPPGVISCCLCLNIKGKRVAATTIVKGYAVCDDHIQVAAEPRFDLFRMTRSSRAV
jgi:hypothetical protein